MDKGQLLNAREMVLEALDARFSSDTPADIKLQIQALPSQAVFSFDPASGIDDPLEKRLEQKLGAGFLVLEPFQPVMISWPLPERCPSPEHRFRRVPTTPADHLPGKTGLTPPSKPHVHHIRPIFSIRFQTDRRLSDNPPGQACKWSCLSAAGRASQNTFSEPEAS
jgi:hypothetical protein